MFKGQLIKHTAISFLIQPNQTKILIELRLIAILSCKNHTESTTTSKNINDKQQTYSTLKSSKRQLDSLCNLNGTYRLKGKNNCNLSIVIEDLKYQFETLVREKKGEIEILSENKETLLKFNGLYGDDPKQIIVAKYQQDNSLIIQNYGNNMNPYTKFSECGDKYLLIEKVNY